MDGPHESLGSRGWVGSHESLSSRGWVGSHESLSSRGWVGSHESLGSSGPHSLAELLFPLKNFTEVVDELVLNDWKT